MYWFGINQFELNATNRQQKKNGLTSKYHCILSNYYGSGKCRIDHEWTVLEGIGINAALIEWHAVKQSVRRFALCRRCINQFGQVLERVMYRCKTLFLVLFKSELGTDNKKVTPIS